MAGLKFSIGAKDAGFTTTIGKINGSVRGMDNNVKKVSGSVRASFAGMAKAGAALAIGFGAIRAGLRALRSVADDFTAAIDLGGRLNDFSARTGETAGNLLVLERAFQNSGVGADKTADAINKMQRAIIEAGQGITTYQRAFDSLGISMEEIGEKTPREQLALIAKRIEGISDPAQRAAAAMQIFGRSGAQLLPLLNNFSGEIGRAEGQLGSLPEIMDRSNAAFDRISDNLAVVKGKTMEVAAGFIESATPAIASFLDKMTGFDAAGFGQRLAESVLKIADMLVGAFRSPMAVIDLIWQTMKTGAIEMANLIVNGYAKAFAFLKGIWQSEMPGIIAEALKDAFSAAWDVFKIMGISAISAIQTSDAMANFGAAINTLWDKLSGDDAGWGDTFDRYRAAAEEVNNQVASDADKRIAELWESSAAKWKGAHKGITIDLGKELESVVASLGDTDLDLFNSDESAKKTSEALDKIKKSGEDFRRKFTDTEPVVEKIKDNTVTIGESMVDAANKVKEALTLSEQIAKRIKEARAKDRVDAGGKLEKQAQAAIQAGNFRKAERIAGKIQESERDVRIKEAFGGGAFGQSVQDLAKQQGIDIFGKSRKELKAELDGLALQGKKRQGELKPGAGGKRRDQVDAPKVVDPMDKLADMVSGIKQLVAKIEPKLPTAALGI